ncbi:MAG: M14 family zinc carboxypeptidase [Pseudomonadota bacterium]
MKLKTLALSLAVGGVLAAPARAQFDAAQVKPEPALVAQRYPDPVLPYQTPGLHPGRTDLTSHSEVWAYLRQLAAKNPSLRLETVDTSQQGLGIPLVLLSANGHFQDDKPTVLILGQQHGNEPAGGEAALALAQQLSTSHSHLLASVNVLIMPRANPDGAQNFVRASANGLDVNRDHLLLQTPEARAIAATALRFAPQVVVDLHEFTVGGRWIDKFGAYSKYDALLQAATVGNMDAGVADLALREFVASARSALESQGLNTFWYHTTSNDAKDTVVSMGGVQADTGRNVYGLRHAVSLLIESRGVGIGRAHYARRVHSHVLAALAVLKSAGAQGPALVQAVATARQAATRAACAGDMVVQAQATPAREELHLVDAKTGADRTESVDWRSSLTLKIQRTRSRPCGYWLAQNQTGAVENLRALGVQIRPLLQDRSARVESYRVLSETGGQRQDARGAIAAQQAIRELTVATDAAQRQLPAGSWYVPMNQPLGALVAAALEPDSQNSFVANHVLSVDANALLRVMQPLAD